VLEQSFIGTSHGKQCATARYGVNNVMTGMWVTSLLGAQVSPLSQRPDALAIAGVQTQAPRTLPAKQSSYRSHAAYP
jgi:hypothetical protein